MKMAGGVFLDNETAAAALGAATEVEVAARFAGFVEAAFGLVLGERFWSSSGCDFKFGGEFLL